MTTGFISVRACTREECTAFFGWPNFKEMRHEKTHQSLQSAGPNARRTRERSSSSEGLGMRDGDENRQEIILKL